MPKPTFSPEEQAQRLNCALEATYEIESISRHLARSLPNDADQLFLRGLVLRLNELNSLAISVLANDDSRDTNEMQKILTGDIV